MATCLYDGQIWSVVCLPRLYPGGVARPMKIEDVYGQNRRLREPPDIRSEAIRRAARAKVKILAWWIWH